MPQTLTTGCLVLITVVDLSHLTKYKLLSIYAYVNNEHFSLQPADDVQDLVGRNVIVECHSLIKKTVRKKKPYEYHFKVISYR